MLEFIFISVSIIVIGGIFCKKPEWIWMLRESWKSERAGEPSEAYIKLMKIEGIIMIVLGVLVFVVTCL